MSADRPSTSEYTPQHARISEEWTEHLQTHDNKRARHSYFLRVGAVLALLIVLGSGLASFLLWHRAATEASASSIIGHAFFVSSGLINNDNNAGTADQLQISLQHIQPPSTGKSYYVWLISDSKTSAPPRLIGTLPVQDGQGTLFYQGDSHHTNLLALYSHFLITEEDAHIPPVNYTLDKSAWIAGAAFSDVPNPNTSDGFSLLEHLRHLLSQDPKLKLKGLTGGLDIWLFRNTEKLQEWADSAKDSSATDFKQRQLVRILDYLDGLQYVGTEKIPASLKPTTVDAKLGSIGLLEIDPLQEPPGYLEHIGIHLREISQSPGVTPDQQALAIRIDNAINNVNAWLKQAHNDAETLIEMPRNQLSGPAATKLFEDLVIQAQNAFDGQIDPDTLQVKEGVVQIHDTIQRLVTFDVQVCTTSSAECAQL